MPLVRRDGSYFGTLCALDLVPAKLGEEDLAILRLVASLIAFELESEDDLRRKEAELAKAEKNAEAREILMGVLGHDLRTPLTAISLGATDLLQREQLTEPAQRTVAGLVASSRRASRMISDLLDFTRARLGGGIPVTRVEADLLAITRKVVAEVVVAHPHRSVSVTATGPTHGQWDPDRAAQAVSNLVSNAVQHSPESTPVEVLLSGGENEVTVEVRNSTAPIPPTLLSEIFDPFRRGASNGEGLGLGLFIVQQILNAHGGEVRVVSEAGQATFVTVWPRS